MVNVREELSRTRTRRLAGMLLTAALVVVIAQQSWGGTPINGGAIMSFLITAITLGSIYGVAAQGLVVTYTTSGVFNFGQGAIGMFMAYVYWQLKVSFGIPSLVAMLLTVLIGAPLLGVIIERVLMRHLVDAPLLSQLVTTIGLMLALMGIAASIWNPNTSRSITTFFGTEGFSLGGTFLPYYRLITILTGVAIGVGLRFLLYHTRLGVSMRAVVDNRDLTMLNGARPARATMTAWALGSSTAALAGIFLAEELSALDVTTLTLFIVDAFAAAIIARLKSLPMAYVGGLIIGLCLSFQENFLNWSGRWNSAPNAIPAALLFIALLFIPQGRIEARTSRRSGHEFVPSLRRALVGFVLLFVVMFVCGALFSRSNVDYLIVAVITALIMLSMVPLTGWANQVSLAQITLMGFGAFALVEWGPGGNLVGLLLAAALAIPVGIFMAFPALRLQGLYLALTTMAFARMAEFLFFDQPEVYGTPDRPVPALSVFGWQVNKPFRLLGILFPQDAGFLLFATIVFSIIGMLVVWSRRGPFGRRLIAMRDSTEACVTMGVDLRQTKLAVFIYSAAIAGLAGGLFAFFEGSVSVTDFQLTVGLPYLLLLTANGVAVVAGTIAGGIGLTLFSWLATTFNATLFFQWLNNIGPGIVGIAVGRNPDGGVVEMSHRLHPEEAAMTSSADGDAKASDLPALPPRRNPDAAVLELRDISVRFGGLQALKGVNVELAEGSITGLIGPNGAGKTTLFNVATGLQEPQAGRIIVDGTDATRVRPHRLARLGVARTFQRLEVFGSLSVRDNIRVAAESHRRFAHDRSIRPDEVADTIIEWVGLQQVASVRADRLPTGTARLVELARALATRPRVLLLDEPSSGLSTAETDVLAALLRRLTSTGLAILLVEHDMGFIMDLCTRIFVLDAGTIIADGVPADVQSDPTVLAAYLGTSAEERESKTKPARSIAVEEPAPLGAGPAEDAEPDGVSKAALQLSSVSAGYGGINALFDVDLVLKPGEVCAVLGPNGAGKSTMLKVASGQVIPTSGEVFVHGRAIAGMTTDQLSRGGLCVVPEGRGVFPNLTVAENLKMATYAGVTFEDIQQVAYDRFPILGQRRRQLAGTLSGGEQQMLAISRALGVHPSILLIDELSMGLAPIIVEQLYEVIAQIAEEGLSLLVVEQFAHEVLNVADVAALLVNGRIAHKGTPQVIVEVLDSAYLGASDQSNGQAKHGGTRGRASEYIDVD